MGNNRSSQHHTYPRGPPPWPHQGGPPPPKDHRGHFDPAVYERTYGIPNQQFVDPYTKGQMRRSMMSLNADSGYVTSPGDSDRVKRGSRLSLNEFAFDRPHPVLIPDPKMMKKMEKKHKKMLKKMGARAPPAAFHPMARPHFASAHHLAMVPPPMGPPPPNIHDFAPPPPQFNRVMSFDNLHHRSNVELNLPSNRDHWLGRERVTRSVYIPEDTSSSCVPRSSVGRNSLESSSPMTSSSDSHNTMDRWQEHHNKGCLTDMREHEDVHEHRESERRVPVHITKISRDSPERRTPNSLDERPSLLSPQARRIIDRNSKVLPDQKDELRSPRPRETVHSIETVEKNEKRHSMMTTNYTQPILRHNTTGYSSCRSSVSGMPRGDQSSEIDFSWVKEEENKMNNNNTSKPAELPECYFGMDPPKVEEKKEEQRRRRESVEHGERQEDHHPVHVMPRSIDPNVRSKTAFFEMEAEIADRHRRERERELMAMRSRSNPHLHDPQPTADLPPITVDTQRNGPSERRLHRINVAKEAQRELDNLQRNRYYNATEYYRDQAAADKQRWRSSHAF